MATNDSVVRLFSNLPDPKDDHERRHDEGIRREFLKALGFWGSGKSTFSSADPDLEFLLHAITIKGRLEHLSPQVTWETVNLLYFLQNLAFLSLSRKPVAAVDLDKASPKDRHLAYWRWVVAGRKYDDYPLQQRGGGNYTKSLASLPVQPAYNRNSLLDFHRMATLLSDIYKVHLKNFYTGNLIRVVEEQGILKLTWARVLSQCADSSIFRPFPENVGLSKDQVLAIAVNGHCHDIATLAKPLIDQLLYPLCSKVEEVTIMVKNAHRPIYEQEQDGDPHFNMLTTHEVVKATLKSGQKLVVDVTGAQFGWEETVAPWDVFEDARVHTVRVAIPIEFGPRRGGNKKLKKGDPFYWYNEAGDTFVRDVVGFLRKNYPPSDLLKLPEEQFKLAVQDILVNSQRLIDKRREKESGTK